MKTYYCWRCKREVAMLEEDEWERISPLLGKDLRNIQRVRAESGCDVTTAVRIAGQEACKLYFEMTGYLETDSTAIWHHRLSNYGPECSRCGHLFRTPVAAHCANCGLRREETRRESKSISQKHSRVLILLMLLILS